MKVGWTAAALIKKYYVCVCVDVCMYVRTRFSQYEMIISLLSCGEYWTRIMTSSGVENKSFPRK